MKPEEAKKYTTLQDEIGTEHDSVLLEALNKHYKENDTNMDNIDCPDIDTLQSISRAIGELPEDVADHRAKSLMNMIMCLVQSTSYVFSSYEWLQMRQLSVENSSYMTLSAAFHSLKQYMLGHFKDKLLENIPSNGSDVNLYYDRNKIKQKYNESTYSPTLQTSYFVQLSKRAYKDEYRCFDWSWVREDYLSVEMKPRNPVKEYKDDEVILWSIDELHSSLLQVMIPSNNNLLKKGEHQDKWILNPNQTSKENEKDYMLIGAIIAYAFKSMSPMNFRFPPIFWKKLAGENLEFEDIASFDLEFTNFISDLKRQLKNGPETFVCKELNFTLTLSGGKTVSLCPNGELKPVTFENVHEFIDLAIQAKLREDHIQMKAVAQGIALVCPSKFLSFHNASEIEQRVRGFEVTVERLQSNYENTEEDLGAEWIDRLWEALKMFTPQELSDFYRACRCKDRIPFVPNKEEFTIRICIDNEDDDPIKPVEFQNDESLLFRNYKTVQQMYDGLMKGIKFATKYHLHGDIEAGSGIDLENSSNDSYYDEEGPDNEGEEDEDDSDSSDCTSVWSIFNPADYTAVATRNIADEETKSQDLRSIHSHHSGSVEINHCSSDDGHHEHNNEEDSENEDNSDEDDDEEVDDDDSDEESDY